jgi:hypothetical protein
MFSSEYYLSSLVIYGKYKGSTSKTYCIPV